MYGKKTTGFGGFPDIHAPRNVKREKTFGLRMFEGMFREWSGHNGSRLERWTDRVAENRKYGNGSQSVNKYKQMFTNNGGDLSYMTLDWSIVPIIPKFVDILVNSAMNKDHEIRVQGIDSMSQEQRQKEKYKRLAGTLLKDFTQDIEALTGISMGLSQQELPDSEEEVDLWIELTYKQATEIAMEKGIEFTFTLNDFREVFKRVCRDLVEVSKGVTRTTINAFGVKIGYVDPMYFVHSYSNDPTAQNIVYAGEIRTVTIGELRSMVEEEVDEERWLKVAQCFTGRYGNPNAITNVSYYPDSNSWNFDSFKVQILEGEFLAYDHDIYERKYNRYGGYTFINKDQSYTPPKNPKYKRELIKDEYDVWYEGIHVIGSNELFDYRPKTNLMRKQGSIEKAKCSYSIYQISPVDGEVKSMVERIIPFADQIQLAHLKMAQHIAKARPKGVIYQVDYMENIPKGEGGDFTILEVQDIHNQTGNLYARVLDDSGKPIPMNFQELEGGVGRALQEFITVYQFNIERIRDVTGLNEMRDGSKPDKDSLVGVQRLALEASNNATRHIDDGLKWVMKDCGETVSLMIQHIVKYKDKYRDIYSDYLAALGDVAMDVIGAMDDVPMRKFGLFVEVAPDTIEKEYLEANIQQALSTGSIELEDASIIRRVKNVKLAEQQLRVIREKRRKQKMQEAQANSEMNAQVNERAAMAKLQAEVEAEKAKAMALIEVERVIAEERRKTEELTHSLKIKEIDRENEWKQKHIQAADRDRQGDLNRIQVER